MIYLDDIKTTRVTLEKEIYS